MAKGNIGSNYTNFVIFYAKFPVSWKHVFHINRSKAAAEAAFYTLSISMATIISLTVQMEEEILLANL